MLGCLVRVVGMRVQLGLESRSANPPSWKTLPSLSSDVFRQRESVDGLVFRPCQRAPPPVIPSGLIAEGSSRRVCVAQSNSGPVRDAITSLLLREMRGRSIGGNCTWRVAVATEGGDSCDVEELRIRLKVW